MNKKKKEKKRKKEGNRISFGLFHIKKAYSSQANIET